MNQTFLRQLVLYRFRYIIGYSLLFLLLIGLSLWQLGVVPHGLSVPEITNTVGSANLPLSPDASPIDLPYHLLQKASLHLFGLTTLGIKLPSIVLGIATGLALLALLERLFKQNVALIAALFAVTASQFLIATRSGDGAVMLLFWPTIIILLATLISQQVRLKGWLHLLLSITLVLSLYTPSMLYLIIAAGVAAIIHPHLRYIARTETNLGLVVLEVLLCGALLVPAGWAIYHQPDYAKQLLGLPDQVPSFGVYLTNLVTTLSNFGNFLNPAITDTIKPAFNLGALTLIIFGCIRVFVDYFSSRSHMILIWSICLLVVVSLKPQMVSVVFIPAVLLMAIGLESLIREWYKLFPRNPYARLGGLLPLVAFIAVSLVFNYTSYFHGMTYAPATVAYFSNDSELLRSDVIKQSGPVVVVSRDDQLAFYGLLSRDRADTTVVPVSQFAAQPTGKVTYVAANALGLLAPTARQSLAPVPARLLVNDLTDQSLRFAVFAPK